MNRIVRDEGVVLRMDPWSNTSRQVLWLMRRHGRTETLLRGALRPKSYLLGQLDLFYRCEVCFYRRPHGGRHAVRECYPLDTHAGLRANWRACATASWLAALAACSLPHGATVTGRAYACVRTALETLAGNAPPRTVQHWFEMQWLDTLGLAPRLDRCVCGRPPDAHRPAFSPVRGGVLCSACQGHRVTDRAVGLAADVLAVLRAWQEAVSPESLLSIRRNTLQINAMNRLLGAFLSYHLEDRLAGRQTLDEVLAEERGIQRLRA